MTAVRNLLSPVLTVLAAVAIVAVGFVVGWRLAGPAPKETDLGRVSFDVGPALGGDVEAFVPIADWGLRADAFTGPFRLKAEVRSVNRAALLRAAQGDRSVLESSEAQIRDGARSAVVRAFAWGAVVAALLLAAAAAVWSRWRSPRTLAVAGGASVAVAVAASLLVSARTFDASAFQRPLLFANGKELTRILEVLENERVESAYGSTFTGILSSLSAVLTEPDPADPAGPTLVAASDLHANALVVDPLSRLIGDDPLLMAGDFGQRGGEREAAALAPRVSALGSRVIAASGNHDSSDLMARLERDGVVVLPSPESGARTTQAEGLVIAGFPDPLEYSGDEPDDPDRPLTFDHLDDPDASLASAEAELLRAFRDLPTRPDVAIVHQNRLAQSLAASLVAGSGPDARPLTIVTGDDHEQHVDRYGEITVVDGGSVGAGGIFDAGSEPIGFARLHFSKGTGALRSVDLIEVEPFSGAARASRVSIGSLCPHTARCTFEPEDVGPGAVG